MIASRFRASPVPSVLLAIWKVSFLLPLLDNWIKYPSASVEKFASKEREAIEWPVLASKISMFKDEQKIKIKHNQDGLN